MLWYFHMEGRCEGNDEINEPFGFFVHVFINSKTVDEALEITSKHLSEEGLEIVDIRRKGSFDSFTWKNEGLEKKLNKLAKIAEGIDEFPIFSEFQSWVL